MSRYYNHPVLEKRLVDETYKGNYDQVSVKCLSSDNSFDLIKFGSFELNDEVYFYGAGLEEFESVIDDPQKNSFALSIAKVTSKGCVLAPFFDFSAEQQEQIQVSIREKFESQITMFH